MRRFQFRLERLARVRRVAEEEARAAWAEGERRARAAEVEHEAVAHRRASAERELARSQSGAVDARAVLAGLEAVERFAQLERARREEAATLRWQSERLQEEWRVRKGDRRAVEKLEERERARHALALAAEEQQEMDEAASSRHSRIRKKFRIPSSPEGHGPDPGNRSSAPSPQDSPAGDGGSRP